MDRGYLDFSRLFVLHQAGTFFVTRAKRGMDARRVYSMPAKRGAGIICDRRIALKGFYTSQDYPEQLRRIRFKDPESGKTLMFLINNTALPVLTNAALYKSRWQVELFQAASAHQAFNRQQRERSEDAGLVRRRHLRADCYC